MPSLPNSSPFAIDVVIDCVIPWGAQLKEDDSPWDFDSLLQSVTQDFNAEKRFKFNAHGSNSSENAGGARRTSSSSQMVMQDGLRRSSCALIS